MNKQAIQHDAASNYKWGKLASKMQKKNTNGKGFLAEQIPVGIVAKNSINPNNFYFAATLTAIHTTPLPLDVDEKTG